MKFTPQSSHRHLEEQNKTIQQGTLAMALPEKSARPLKKRRIVGIELDVTSQQPINDSSRGKPRNKKAKRTRTAVSPLPSPPTSPPKTVIKKTVTFNDPDGNIVHVQPDPMKLHPCFNESDVWYTVSYSSWSFPQKHHPKHPFVLSSTRCNTKSSCFMNWTSRTAFLPTCLLTDRRKTTTRTFCLIDSKL